MKDSSEGSFTDQKRADPLVTRMWLGAQLRRLREEKGVTLDEAGYHIRGSASKMSRLELGRHKIKLRDVEDLLTLYEITDPALRAMLLTQTKKAAKPGWWQPFKDLVPDWFEAYLGQEQAASVIRVYEAQLIPALLQTSAYARAVLTATHYEAPKEQLERRLTLHMRREDILGRPDPPSLWAVIDEAALRRPFGGPEVMRAQIRHLIEVAELRHISIHVLPFSAGGHPAVRGAITLVRLPEYGLRDVVYLEHLENARYLDKPEDVSRYRNILDRLAVKAIPAKWTTKVLHRILGDS